MAKRWINSADVAIDDATGELLVRVGGACDVKRAAINCSSAAAAGNTLVTAVAGKKVRVLNMLLTAADEVDATFYSGPADTGTALTGPLMLGKRGGFIEAADAGQLGSLETAAGEALTLKLSSAVQVGGKLAYIEV